MRIHSLQGRLRIEWLATAKSFKEIEHYYRLQLLDIDEFVMIQYRTLEEAQRKEKLNKVYSDSRKKKYYEKNGGYGNEL